MKKLNPDKLAVIITPDVNPTGPPESRRYTVTHSDTSGGLALIVGSEYDRDKLGPQKDGVLSEWRLNNDRYYLYVYVDVDSQFSPMAAAVRYTIFRRELPLCLEAIRYGDQAFFRAHPELDSAPIWVYFDSSDPYYNGIELWGTLSDFKNLPVTTGQ